VVLAGAAGVGKTRLGFEALRLAERAGCATVRVTGTRSAAGLPFGALAPLLPAAGSAAAGMVDSRAELLRRLAGALVDGAGGRRLVLLADDAHLLDDASATLIHQMVLSSDAFILATVRAGEPAPDSIVNLWKDGVVERIEVLGLPTRVVEDLLGSVLDGPVDPAAAVRLAVRSQGNVMFLREIVVGCLHDGTLRDDGGLWRLVGWSPPSDRLVEIVEARLGRLDAAERALLEAVSFAEPLGPAELTAVGDLAVAEDLERKGLLTSFSEGARLQIRLAHPVYGDVLQTRMPALRMRSVARALAEAVEKTGARRREDVLRVGTWRLEGGGAQPDLMLAAATAARWRYDFPLAERLARSARHAGAGFDAALLEAQLATVQGRAAAAEGELASLADQAGDDARRGAVAVARLDNYLYQGRIDEGMRIAEEAERCIIDEGWRDAITAKRSLLLLGSQGPKAAADAAQPLLGRAGGTALALACQVAAYSFGRLGRFQAALEAAERGHSAHLSLSEPVDWYPFMHMFCRGEALTHAGRLPEAQALAAEQYQEGLESGSTEAQAWFAWQLGKGVGDRGNIRTAIGHLRTAVALFRELGRPQFVHVCLPYLALAWALARRTKQATDTLATLDALHLPSTLYMGTDALEARAWTAVASGDLSRARAVLEEAAGLGERVGDLVGRSIALHSLARLGYAKDVASPLGDVAAQIEGELASTRAGHAAGLAGGDPEVLAEASVAFETMGADLLAAECAADAAVAWRRAGDSKAAAAGQRRAVMLADRCEGAATPALQAIETRVRLTPAERETALQAATGRSSKEIAEKLVLSVRTVETRLQRIYEKLGVSSRTQLAAALELSGCGSPGTSPDT
jgi:DNA-binding CsgD family transcriptional regulator